ncbi:MAG TPA: hypothetical protein VFB43_09645 [Terracidiphilus sp.]|nr:hypothetical protein [Terracidiphilus sp.]
MPGLVRFSIFNALFIALCAVSYGQAPPAATASTNSSDPLPQKIVQMLNTQVVWDNGFNHPRGPRLRFSKLDEVTRTEGHFTRYRIYTAGVPEGQPYILAAWSIGADLKDLNVLSSNVYVNRKGLLLTRKPNPDEEDRETVGEDAEYDLGVQAADGEPLRFVLRSQDNKVLVPGTLVPFPIESTDRGCKLSALLAEPDGEAILIEGDGFPPDSSVLVQGISAGEPRKSKQTVDASGHLQFVELPYVVGKETGTLNDTISTKDCTVSVIIPWGKGTYRRH